MTIYKKNREEEHQQDGLIQSYKVLYRDLIFNGQFSYIKKPLGNKRNWKKSEY